MTKINYKRGTYKKEDRICIVCGSIFKGTKKAKFCSNKCKQRDKYKRLKNDNSEQNKKGKQGN